MISLGFFSSNLHSHIFVNFHEIVVVVAVVAVFFARRPNPTGVNFLLSRVSRISKVL